MLVLNDVSGDSRVQKSAAVVSQAGYRVTVVGRSMTAERTVEWYDGVRIVRVPVPLLLKRYTTALRALPGTPVAPDLDRAAQRSLRSLLRARRRLLKIKGIRARLDAAPGSAARRPWRVVQWARIWALRKWARRDRRKAKRQQARVARRDVHPRFEPARRSPPSDTPVRWRDELSVISDFELAYLPVVDELEPDLIHAHDHSALAIAEHATLLARGRGRPVKLLYDAHEYVHGIPHDDERTGRAWIELEREHIRTADAIITVSPVLSQRLRDEHDLPRCPEAVLNAPLLKTFDSESEHSVRAAASVAEGTPLLVYSGGVKPQRSVGTLVEALPYMPGVHVAVVARAESRAVQELRDLAEKLDCVERLHIVPFVHPDMVSSYLRTADVGVHTILRSGNADIALPNKMFEYFHAGLPMVVSDAAAMAQFTREHGTGESFPAKDHRALAAACLRVLGDLDRYRRPFEDVEFLRRYSWERQAETLIQVYGGLLPPGQANQDTGRGEGEAAPLRTVSGA
jgi:glycosyltransferase involved in cell wall biosynthesis